MNDFHYILKIIRTGQSISQEKLSKICGISLWKIGKFENNEQSPTVEDICKLSKSLSVSTDRLLGMAWGEEDFDAYCSGDVVVSYRAKYSYDGSRNADFQFEGKRRDFASGLASIFRSNTVFSMELIGETVFVPDPEEQDT